MTVPKEIIDAHKAYQYIRSLGFKGKVFMVGHSQGGVVAGMTSGELGSDSIAGLVLMAPAAVLKDDALKGNTMGVKYDPVNPPAYVEIYGKKLGRDYIKSAQTLPIYETTQQYNGPISVIHGKDDFVVPYSYGERYHNQSENSEIHILDDEDHSLSKHLDKTTDIAVKFIKNQVNN